MILTDIMIEQALQVLVPYHNALKDRIRGKWDARKRNQEIVLSKECRELQRKSEAALDGYCAGILSAEEYQQTKARYQAKIQARHEQLSAMQQRELNEALLQPSQRLYRCLVERICVFQDRHMELHFINLSETTFIFR